MPSEKYITNGAYGVKPSDAPKGFTNESVSDEETGETWIHEYEEKEAYRNIGFGRDTGYSR